MEKRDIESYWVQGSAHNLLYLTVTSLSHYLLANLLTC